MKIETFATNARAKGHSVQIDRKNRCATVTDSISDGYRVDVYVHFDENRDITWSYKNTIVRYSSENDDSGYAGGMALIALRDLRWNTFNSNTA